MADAVVHLVPLGEGHKARTREWANDPEVARLMDRARPVSAAEHETWFASLPSRSDCAYFAVEQEVEPRHVGNVWLWAIDDRHHKAELRIVIGDPAARGRGLGHQAIDQLCRYGFEQRGLHRIYAYVLAFNAAARHAFEQACLRLEGTQRDDRCTGDTFTY
jgi:RimJ/RimL family protein N-acetyltransferase